MGKIEMKPRTVVLGREVCVIIVVRSYEHYVNFGYGDVQLVTGHLATREFRHQPTHHQEFYSFY